MRLKSIDALRGLAILFMILCHFVIYLAVAKPQGDWIYALADNFFGVLAAPLFLFLVGLSRSFSIDKDGYRGRQMRQGTILFVLGLFFALLVWGPENLLEWDVLPVTGVSIILLALFKKMPLWTLVFLAVLIVLVTPTLRDISQYAQYWNYQLEDLLGFSSIACAPKRLGAGKASFINILRGFFTTGYFPFFPWFLFPLSGYVVGRRITDFSPLVLSGLGGLLCLSGVALAISASFTGATEVGTNFISPLCFYPNSTSLLIINLGVVLLLFGLLRRFLDSRIVPSAPFSYLEQLSRYSLSLYFLHHLLIVYPSKIIRGLMRGNVPLASLSSGWALAAGVGLLIGLHFFLPYWERKQWPSLEKLLRG